MASVLAIMVILLAVRRARRGERAQAVAVGRLHDRGHDPDRDADGRSTCASGARAACSRPRSVGLALVLALGGGRPVGGALGRCAPLFTFSGPALAARGDRLRLRGLGAAGVAAARAARLPLGLHQGRRRARSGGRHPASCARRSRCRRSRASSTAAGRCSPGPSSRSASSRSPAAPSPASTP